MKIITKEKKVTTSYTAYVAEDGTEFLNEKACEEYENTAYHTFSIRFMSIAKRVEGDKAHQLDCLLDSGCGAARFFKVTPKDDAEVNIIMNFAVANDCCFGEKDETWGIHADELKAGTTYILALFDDVACMLYSKERLTARVTEALSAFDKDEEAKDDEAH